MFGDSSVISARLLSLLIIVFTPALLPVRPVDPLPAVPPRAHASGPAPVVRVLIEYDDDFAAGRAESAEEAIAHAMSIVNVEWQRYRGEWFDIAELRRASTGDELDASHVLATFLLSTASAPSSIHVRIVGRQLEVYSDGRRAMPVGGLAFRGSDAVVVSAPANVPVELLAYYLFHEIGHLWEAYDIPFRGGETTFGEKSRYTFDVDAGNAEILDESRGPAPRDTPNLAPAILRARLAAARKITRDPALLARLHDLLLHEATPSNPAWVRKKRELFAATGDPRIRRLVAEQETTPGEAREQSELRRLLAEHYWRANEALERGEAETAELALGAMREIQLQEANADIHMLIGAVERKIRKRAH